MYVSFGWPRVLSVPGDNGRYIFVHLDQSHFLAVSETAVQVWSGGGMRVLLGQHVLSQQEQEQYGRQIAASWCSDKSSMAVVTANGWLLVYALHTLKATALATSSSNNSWSAQQQQQQALWQQDIYIKHTVQCDHTALPTCLCSDSRSILVAYADGCIGSCNWSGKVRPHLFCLQPGQQAGPQQQQQWQHKPVAMPEQPHKHRPQNNNTVQSHQPHHQRQQQQKQLQQVQQLQHANPCWTITRMHYCQTSRLLAVVFACGAAAVYSCCNELSVSRLDVQELQLRCWLCGPEARATTIQIESQAQLIAVGASKGSVLLFKLPFANHSQTSIEVHANGTAAAVDQPEQYSSSNGTGSINVISANQEPWQAFSAELYVRTLELSDWGHTPQQTGGVQALSWTPDGRALAVGFDKQGLAVWTPSGCRLLCTLRQPAPETPRLGNQVNSSTNSSTSSSSPFAQMAGSTVAAAANIDLDLQQGSQMHQQPNHQHAPVLSSVDGAVDCLAWGPGGYQLLVAGRHLHMQSNCTWDHSSSGSSSSIGHNMVFELSFAKTCRQHRVSHAASGAGTAQLGEELYVLQAADRLLMVTEALTGSGPGSGFAAASMNKTTEAVSSDSDLHVHHVPLPAPYLAGNWPLQHVAVSSCGSDVAAAGVRGLALYNRRHEKWRLFGDVSQERRISCIALGWLSSFVVACSCVPANADMLTPDSAAAAAAKAAAVAAAAASGVDLNKGVGAGFKCQLLLFPRNHLDMASVAASMNVSKVPLAMDCTDQHIVLLSAPSQMLMLQLDSHNAGSYSLTAVRELFLPAVGRPISDVALVTAAATDAAKHLLEGSGDASSTAAAVIKGGAPAHGVLLRWGGLLSVVDLMHGNELILAEQVESFWLSDTLPVAPANGSMSNSGSKSTSATHSCRSSIHNLSTTTPSLDAAAVSRALEDPLPAAAAAAAFGNGSINLNEAWGAAVPGNGGNPRSEAPEVVEMPWWAYGPIGMQLWFPSVVLAAMQQPLDSSMSGISIAGSSSGSLLAVQSQPSFPAQLSPHGYLSSHGGGQVFSSSFTPRASDEGNAWQMGPSRNGLMIAAPELAQQQQQQLQSAKQRSGVEPIGAATVAAAAGSNEDSATSQEMELEFDREVYPVGISLADASVIGVMQRVSRPHVPAALQATPAQQQRRRSDSSSGGGGGGQQGVPASPSSVPAASPEVPLSLPCFIPVPESQPVLPALLRRLLQYGSLREALALANKHANGPHFKRSLEWLLFTTLDMEAGKCKPAKQQGHGSSKPKRQQQQQAAPATLFGRKAKAWLGHEDGNPVPVPVTPLLASAVQLVLSFQQCLDVVVSVSRKTDAALWPALFSAVGSPSALFELLLETGALGSAACFLIVVDRLEGPRQVHACAVNLMMAAIRKSQFVLCAEILRFLIPPRESASGAVHWGPMSPCSLAAVDDDADAGPTIAAATDGLETGKAADIRSARARQHEAQQTTATNGSGWFSWIWGSSSSTTASAADTSAQQQKQQPVAEAASAADHHAIGQCKAANSSSNSSEGAAGSPANAAIAGACGVVAQRAWWLLEHGMLHQLAQLAHSMDFLSEGLAGIMLAYTPATAKAEAVKSAAATHAGAAAAAMAAKFQQQEGSDALTVAELKQCVRVAMHELPVWSDSGVEQDANLLLKLTRRLGVIRWYIALAVLLLDMSVITPYAAKHPQLWLELCKQLGLDEHLYFLHDVVGALAAAAAGDSSTGGVGSA